MVLHGHLPYVLRHGVWPHGEDWLYEAAAETYLPVLDVLGACELLDAPPRVTIGLTPVLLEQLAHAHFKDGFEHFLADRIAKAEADEAEFREAGDLHMAHLAERWRDWYGARKTQFDSIERDIPRAFARFARDGGPVELLTSAATHGYFPLLYEDASIRAQLRAGLASSHRILGYRPTGMWLPECAYRPGGDWDPPIGWASKPGRIGVEHLIGHEGIDHFFVETHLIEGGHGHHALSDGTWHPVPDDEAAKYPARGWNSVNEAYLVNSDTTGPGKVAVMARDAKICEQIWSGSIGYPAHGKYLEFHKQWGPRRGLRYWKITGKDVDLGGKEAYYPDDIPDLVHEQARHFCDLVRDQLREHHSRTGRKGVVCATFDAELFGHWWFEGPLFLREVILTLNADPEIDLQTSEGYLRDHPPDKTIFMPEGSWGEEGDHRVWTNEKINWMWDIEYRCEANFGKATLELPWQKNKEVEDLLKKAARELLLLQASDWPFVVTRGQAVDYGIKRFMQHVARFECLLDHAEKIASDSDYLGTLTEVELHEIKDAELHDIIFPEMELEWWQM